MKFSIIIPVYNVEAYLDKCLASILKQTYENFEVIIVNDGTKDNSQKIIDKYVKKDQRFKGYIKENGGLSSARNYGLKYMTGDYLLFVDSDDYLEVSLLAKLNDTLTEHKTDIVRFNCVTCDTDGNIISKYRDREYIDTTMDLVIGDLTRRAFFEPAWLYCYKVSFWKKYHFTYPVGRIHEDFGLTPLILYYAQTISIIDYDGYFYVMREGSITKAKDYQKIKKGADDTYDLYLNIVDKLQKEPDNIPKKAILTYMSECMINKCMVLDKKDRKEYYQKLRKLKVTDYMYGYNPKKIIKKMVAGISLTLYNKLFRDVIK